jgi:signal transduction histidine kinase
MGATTTFVQFSRVPEGVAPVSGYMRDAPGVRAVIGAYSGWVSLALAAVAVLAVVLLRRKPLPALVLLLAGSLASPLAAFWPAEFRPVVLDAPVLLAVPVLLVGAAVAFIAATRPRRISVPAAAVALGVQVGAWATSPAGAGRIQTELFLGTSPELAVALVAVTAWLIGHSIRQSHTHVQAMRAQADAAAATAERLRIARDLHDMVAHSIGIIAIQAGMGRRVIDTQPSEARDALAAIEATSRETLAGLRRTVGALRQIGPGQGGRGQAVPGPGAPGQAAPGQARPRPADPGPLDPPPGLADLGRLFAGTLDAGVRVEVRWPGQCRPLPAEVDSSAYRIIQEAVTNVVRHAGTSQCRVTIDQRDEELAIEVIDDGRGGPATGGEITDTGYGIAGMRERAALLHGELAAGPRPGGGFRVAATLPLPAADPLPAAPGLLSAVVR